MTDTLPCTVVPAHAVPELIGFKACYGVPVTPLGEDDEDGMYLAVGHDPRHALAAAMRWARVNYRQRYRDWQWLRVERLWAVFSALVDDPRDWELEYVSAGLADAVPVTLVTGLEDLEEYVRPSRCPMCNRMRATGREAHDGSPWYPEKPTTWVHECPCTGGLVGYTWPAERHTTAVENA